MNPADYFSDHTFTMVTVGTAVIGGVAGALGSFAYLRRQSLISDVISHAALPGTLLAFLLLTALGLDGRSMAGLLLGATTVGTVAVIAANAITRHSRIAIDTAMAVVLSSLFGLGMLLIQYIQRTPLPGKGGIQDHLFGNASTITRADLTVSLLVGVGTLAMVGLFWKEFALATFDRDLAGLLGFHHRVLDPLVFCAITVATVIGVKAVGLVLMVAFVVTPPAAARQWTRTLPTMVALSGLFGATGAAVGAYLSIVFGPVPTGPVIVLVLFTLFLLSLTLSPRGVVLRTYRRHQPHHLTTLPGTP
ncbi:metal ABC transporter permease [Corynebacterium sp.]|uniref:metal ABC transporter permease n=1 Tax=Corynebacterium sp. TaxID=1720 RepID=UPI0019BA40BF|nr:metal ABC transporter permease [Corynebacterium sp.]HHU67825.1 metal ABC transporter permease [Corynebacterium sp.]